MPDYNPDYYTDGHIDGIARFIRPGTVLVEETGPDDPDYRTLREVRKTLEAATDARGRRLEVHAIRRPRTVPSNAPNFCACYVNYYVANGGVVMARFGDEEADREAKQVLASLFPDRTVAQVAIDAIASGGGGIHCSTQQQPIGKKT